MPINFPTSPTLNQQFTSGGTTWVWDGTTWNLHIGENIVTYTQLSSILSDYQESIQYVSSAPTSPTPNSGDYYVNSSDNMLYVYVDAVTGWVSLGSAGDSDQAILAGRMFL